jgi:transposase-like protein
MPKTQPPYPPEFRQRMIELVRSGRTPNELAKAFEPSAQAIRNWVAQAGAGRRQRPPMRKLHLWRPSVPKPARSLAEKSAEKQTAPFAKTPSPSAGERRQWW